MPSLKHTHKYRRKRGSKDLYFCTLPGCFHRISKDYLYGKLGLCPNCGEEFPLGYEELKRAEPKCVNCRNDKTARAKRAAMIGLAESMPQLFVTPALLEDDDDEIEDSDDDN